MKLMLRKLKLEEFKDIHYDYLVEDFPFIERKPFYFLAKMYEEGRYISYVLEERGQVRGYASFVWKDEDVLLLDYFATVSGRRGSGIGSKMIKLLARELEDKLIIFECESPERAKTEEEKIIRQKRIAFYKKNGAYSSNIEISVFGVVYKVMYISKKIKRKNIKYEIKNIYENMLPKFVFKKAAKII